MNKGPKNGGYSFPFRSASQSHFTPFAPAASPIKSVKVQANTTKLGVGQRGIILPPPVEFEPSGAFSVIGMTRPQIDAALLYWDAIEYPINMMIEIASEDITSLVQLGVATRTEIKFEGGWSGAELLSTGYDEIIKALSAQSPGRWSHLTIPRGQVPSKHSHDVVTVRLIETLPLPQNELPFEELLEFKSRRRDELLDLRTHIDQLADVVVVALDGDAALARKIDALHTSLRAMREVSTERFGICRGFSIKPSFSLTDALKSGAIAFGASGGDLKVSGIAALAGAAMQSIDVSLERSGGTPQSGPLKYAISIENELSR